MALDLDKYPARTFSQKAYDESDQFAKDLFIDCIIRAGFLILSSSENTYFDIIASKNGVIYNFELETKYGRPFTHRETFMFDTVSFLGRKERLHKIDKFYYVIICKETHWALYADSDTIFQDQWVEEIDVNSRDRYGKDKMFRVPKEMCYFFNLMR